MAVAGGGEADGHLRDEDEDEREERDGPAGRPVVERAERERADGTAAEPAILRYYARALPPAPEAAARTISA